MYDRTVDQQTLTFRVSGKLWMRSLVMADTQTGSEWAHQLGTGMAGPLKGKELKPLISDLVSWRLWRAKHPETTVLAMSRTAHDFTAEFYREPSMFVLGFKIGAKAYALSLHDMQQQPVYNFGKNGHRFVAAFKHDDAAAYLYDARIGDATLEFFLSAQSDERMVDRGTGSVWSIASGQCLEGRYEGQSLKPQLGIMSFRSAWEAFHPASQRVEFQAQ